MSDFPHGTVCWNELTTRDAKQAGAFFSELLGWTLTERAQGGAPYLMAHAGGQEAAGLLQMTEEFGGMPSHWMTYIAVDDVDAAVAQVPELGGTVCYAPFSAPGVGRIAIIQDPTGATVSLITLDRASEG